MSRKKHLEPWGEFPDEHRSIDRLSLEKGAGHENRNHRFYGGGPKP